MTKNGAKNVIYIFLVVLLIAAIAAILVDVFVNNADISENLVMYAAIMFAVVMFIILVLLYMRIESKDASANKVRVEKAKPEPKKEEPKKEEPKKEEPKKEEPKAAPKAAPKKKVVEDVTEPMPDTDEEYKAASKLRKCPECKGENIPCAWCLGRRKVTWSTWGKWMNHQKYLIKIGEKK